MSVSEKSLCSNLARDYVQYEVEFSSVAIIGRLYALFVVFLVEWLSMIHVKKQYQLS